MTTTLPAPEVQDAPAPAPARAATRADVARAAGVSTAVVSYVVNEGPRRVAPHTAARVRAAIAALAYSPNVAARSLRKGSSEMVAWSSPTSATPTSPSWPARSRSRRPSRGSSSRSPAARPTATWSGS